MHVDEKLVALGIALATVGACVSGYGMNLLKASAHCEDHLPWYKRRKMMLGLLLVTCVNTGLDGVAFAVTPLSIIAPIGGFTIVSSVLFARCGVAGVQESVSKAQWMAAGSVVVGVAFVDEYGPRPDPVLNSTLVLQRIDGEAFSIYESATLAVVLASISMLRLNVIRGTGITTAVATALAAGMCSGVTMTMMKVMAVCTASWIVHGQLPFAIFNFWYALLQLVVVALVLMYLLRICMASAAMSVSSSLYQSSLIIFTITAGCAFYGELADLDTAGLVVFVCGVSFVILGLAVLIALRPPAAESRLLPAADAAAEACLQAADAAAEARLEAADAAAEACLEAADEPRGAEGDERPGGAREKALANAKPQS